jgi:putative restriction endonuclease
VRSDVLEERDGPTVKHGLQKLHGARIPTPPRAEHQPRREYLAERFARFEAA